jgi:CheY-like chemotaxis protein
MGGCGGASHLLAGYPPRSGRRILPPAPGARGARTCPRFRVGMRGTDSGARPRMVMMDIRMPALDGIKATERLTSTGARARCSY